ncbi:M43 family zinc metalloprotease [Aquimarina sp. 2201CG5-10]|uniref:M43 family zinc metalloprotease n=1 Tax=Aquimarina callyspongiae TaxID=3098150 RepID=UPI002AB40E77|nr:M43 family zinc metalloprotease [Aquimarina sp. 2201CG5-10]MDY8138749.1 M43 family zinc metalloprotease [Aquimarina sp. 2201CG5-10]
MKNYTLGAKSLMHTCLLILYLILIMFWQANAQTFTPNTCGTDQQMDILYRQQPNALSESQSLRQKISQFKTNNQAEPYVIPVVFHVFGTEFNGGSTVTNAIIEEALRLTNEDFQGLNADYSTIDAPFDIIKQPLDITFKLAKLDPSGNPTTGVVFYNEASGMGNYSSPIVPQVAWDNYKYCNIYITRDLYNDGDFYNSGVAWYPNNSMSAANIARVVYNGSYLGTNTNENFRSVLTHEFGHYLDLPHTFDRGVCNNDPNDGDGVADTPSHINNSSGTNCQVVQNCLNQEINNENFMDYTDCYKMFTQGQVARMNNALENSPARNTLWTNANLIATGLVSDLGTRIIASSNLFEERYFNDGVIESTIELTCDGCTFINSSGDLTLNTDYTVTNLPAGLSTRIELTSTTTATIHLENAASNHEQTNSIGDLTFTFLDPMVTGGVSQLYKDSLENLKINFKDEYTEYCNINIRYATYGHITNVEFDGRTNPSGYDGISNYSQSAQYSVRQGETYPITITTNKGASGAGDNWRIQGWFDWNNNFIYEDGELAITHTYSNNAVDGDGNYTYATSVTIPPTASLENTAFRVIVHYVQGNEGDEPCSTIDSGESEDYGLKIVDANAAFAMDFYGNPTSVNFSQEVTFSDLTITDPGDTITNWQWTFEGGQPTSSTDRNPANIIFSEAGSYDVTLQVTTANGTNQTITKTDYITSELDYCDSSPKFGTYFNVNHVTLETIDHEPNLSNSYDYYDSVFTTLVTGETYPITIKSERGNGGAGDVNRVRVWADWNFDSAFTQDEMIVSQEVKNEDYNQNDEYEFTANITVPNDAAVGKKVGLRIIGHYVDGSGGETSCGDYDSGNTSDYGILISNGVDPIDPIYCDASNQDATVHITRVTFGNVDNSSAHNPYSDYTGISETFSAGDQFTLTVNTTNEHWTYNAVGTWIDWNNDGIFDNDTEKVLHAYRAGPYSSTVTVPESATTNTTLRVRVRIGYGAESKITPCGDDTYFGEVEDYSLTVSNTLSLQEIDILNPVIYPTPTRNELNIISPTNKEMDIAVITLQGQKIMQTTTIPNNKKIRLSLGHLPNGIYFIVGKQNDQIFNKKVVVFK